MKEKKKEKKNGPVFIACTIHMSRNFAQNDGNATSQFSKIGCACLRWKDGMC
jgi:hypothetical protein